MDGVMRYENKRMKNLIQSRIFQVGRENGEIHILGSQSLREKVTYILEAASCF